MGSIDDERYTTRREISLQIPPKLRYSSLSSHLTPLFQISLMTPESYGLFDCIEDEASMRPQILRKRGRDDKSLADDSDDSESDDSQKTMWVDDIHLSTAGHRVGE